MCHHKQFIPILQSTKTKEEKLTSFDINEDLPSPSGGTYGSNIVPEKRKEMQIMVHCIGHSSFLIHESEKLP